MTYGLHVSLGLKNVSAGWVDTQLLTVRRMAVRGATAEEIGAAVGLSTAGVSNFIRRNGIVWNRKSIDRHIAKSAQAISSHMAAGKGAWHDEAMRLRRSGMKLREISAALGVDMSAISAFCARRNIRKGSA